MRWFRRRERERRNDCPDCHGTGEVRSSSPTGFTPTLKGGTPAYAYIRCPRCAGTGVLSSAGSSDSELPTT